MYEEMKDDQCIWDKGKGRIKWRWKDKLVLNNIGFFLLG